MFKTFEEVQEKYPIGTKVNYKKNTIIGQYFYASPEDIRRYRQEYHRVEVVDDKYVKCYWDSEDYNMVDGYLYNGEYWYPVENTWDGWVPIVEREDD